MTQHEIIKAQAREVISLYMEGLLTWMETVDSIERITGARSEARLYLHEACH